MLEGNTGKRTQWLAPLLLAQTFSCALSASSPEGQGPPDIDSLSPTSPAMEPGQGQQDAGQQPELLALPAPQGEGDGTISLDVSTGDKVSLDHLGPVIVTLTGQLRRINNWAEMTEREQAVTRRRITKRNRERLAKLRAAQATEAADVAPPAGGAGGGGDGEAGSGLKAAAAGAHREL